MPYDEELAGRIRRLVDETAAEVAVMRNRPLTGWLRVGSEHLGGDALEPWVARGVAYARSLPARG